jgi:hypothetical protein
MNRDEAIEMIDRLREFVQVSGDAWHKKGYDFERRFGEMCFSRGLDCVRAGRGHFDFVVDGLRVQCKCLVPDAKGKVYVQPGSGPAYLPNSFDVLAIETPKGMHLIPETSIPRTRSGLLQAALSICFLERFTDAWWAIETGQPPAGFEKQLMFSLNEQEATDGR